MSEAASNAPQTTSRVSDAQPNRATEIKPRDTRKTRSPVSLTFRVFSVFRGFSIRSIHKRSLVSLQQRVGVFLPRLQPFAATRIGPRAPALLRKLSRGQPLPFRRYLFH